jgi:hypothetical protein
MWIERIRAIAFGPLVAEELEFGPGMNVIIGPNESGKSSWHATLFAAVCGMRRSRGAPRLDDKEFASRHRPWSGADWRASAIVHLADGRRIEISQDLGTMVDCRATDLTVGRDVSSEIMGDGSPDGSRWLGLDRTSFLATACVRQADVLEVQQNAGALQDALQRAAASARAESTAAEAIGRLEEFERDQIGTERAPTRPLRQAGARVDAARRELQLAEQGHSEFLSLSREVEEARAAAGAAQRRAWAADAARAMLDADALTQRLAEARELLGLFPDGEPPAPSSDEEQSRQVATTLDRWQRKPTLAELDGDTSSVIRSRMAELTEQSEGDREVHQSVARAWTEWTASGTVLRQLELERPEPLPAPETRSHSVADLFGYASALSAPSVGQAAGPVSPVWYLAGAALAIAGVGCLAVGLIVPAVAALAVAATLVGIRLMLPRRALVPPQTEIGADAVQADLLRRGLPTTAEALHALAQAALAFEQRQAAIGSWNERHDLQTSRSNSAEERLRTALRTRGMAVGESDPVADSFASYEGQCRMRLESANRLQTVRVELQARELKEEQYATVVRDLTELEEELRQVAASVGVVPERQDDLATMVSGLELWQQHRGERLREFESRRRRWDRLEMLLDGRPLEALEADARDAHSKADTLVALVAPADVVTAAEWLRGSNGQAQHEAVRAEEREARETLATLAERLRLRGSSMRDVPAAREECASADAELGRLRDLAEVIRLTRRFMESAVDRAHRTIAPVLQSALSDRLAAVTHGRYVEALVDPETLAVQVRGDGRSWRSASALSHGTAEQVYLLLRVALAEHLVRAGESTPFVFDDATVQSDNVRTLAIMETLLSLTPAHQVIVFSQETEVAEWARARLDGEQHRLIELRELPVER